MYTAEFVWTNIGICLFIGLFLYWSYRREQKRIKGLRDISAVLGFSFKDAPPSDFLSPVKELDIFSLGFLSNASNVLEKKVGSRTLKLFDYYYMVNSGKRRRFINQTIAWIQDDSCTVPSFKLRPEGILDKCANLIGFTDINFSHYPIFSKYYHLKGEDSDSLKNVFTPEVVRFLETDPTWSIETHQNSIVAYRPKKLVDHDEIQKIIADVQQFERFYRT